MRVLHHLVWSAAASVALFGVTPAAVHADTAPACAGAYCPTQELARGADTAPNPPGERYRRGDWRLGPAHLPTTGSIGRMLLGYRATDPRSSYRLLDRYWRTNPQTGVSGWRYPDHDGFVLHHGRPVRRSLTLRAGQLVDLFGSGHGNFLAPAGTPYAKRALPPSNLDEHDPAYPLSYHLYRVTTPFVVQAGPIRPWFGQPGLGLQYLTSTAIPNLITSGHLRALN